MAKTKEPKSDYMFDNNLSELDTLLPPSAFSEKTNALRRYVTFPKVTFKLLVCLAGWYVLNAVYVVENKVILTLVPLPWTLSCLQLLVGWVFAPFFWATGLRSVPSFKSTNVFFKVMVPQSFCHLFVHLGAVISMGIGAVSFTHLVKSAEPVVTALFSALFLDDYLSLQSYLLLLPVVVGVALASVKELHFSWVSFWFAMLSNAGCSARSVFAKLTVKNKDDIGRNLTSSNVYYVETLVGSLGALVLAYFTESKKWVPYILNATLKMTQHQKKVLLLRTLLSCVCYFLCNDLAFVCLGEMNQVSHAIANTVKRVVIITTSIVVFDYKITKTGYFGMAIAILGALAYSTLK